MSNEEYNTIVMQHNVEQYKFQSTQTTVFFTLVCVLFIMNYAFFAFCMVKDLKVVDVVLCFILTTFTSFIFYMYLIHIYTIQ